MLHFILSHYLFVRFFIFLSYGIYHTALVERITFTVITIYNFNLDLVLLFVFVSWLRDEGSICQDRGKENHTKNEQNLARQKKRLTRKETSSFVQAFAIRSLLQAMDNWLEETSVDITEGFVADEWTKDKCYRKRWWKKRPWIEDTSKCITFILYSFLLFYALCVYVYVMCLWHLRVALLLRDIKEQGNSRLIALWIDGDRAVSQPGNSIVGEKIGTTMGRL